MSESQKFVELDIKRKVQQQKFRMYVYLKYIYMQYLFKVKFYYVCNTLLLNCNVEYINFIETNTESDI